MEDKSGWTPKYASYGVIIPSFEALGILFIRNLAAADVRGQYPAESPD
jgi:hypothetical protein